MSLASPSLDGAKCSSLLQVQQAVVNTIRSAKSYFLVFIMEEKQHTRNISRDNRAKMISNLKEAVTRALCRHGVYTLI